MSLKVLYEYDDPYTILAHALVGFSRPADVFRMLTDNTYLLSCIAKEVRDQDLQGRFLDCIIADLFHKKQRMDYVHALDSLAIFFYKSLDKERLRKEIKAVLEAAGIELPDYSAGSVSSANA